MTRMTKPTFRTSDNLLYRLLASPSYRPLRHVVFVLAILAISLSQSSHVFVGNANAIGGWIYLLAASSATAYLLVGYLHIYCLVPKFLFKKRYAIYIALSAVLVLLLACLKPLQEYLVNESLGIAHSRGSYFGMISILDLLSDFMITILCITGVSMTVLLKEWTAERNRVAALEKKIIGSEISSMKERVNPEQLLDTLHRIGSLADSDPDEAAETILQLSASLRHELYDVL